MGDDVASGIVEAHDLLELALSIRACLHATADLSGGRPDDLSVIARAGIRVVFVVGDSGSPLIDHVRGQLSGGRAGVVDESVILTSGDILAIASGRSFQFLAAISPGLSLGGQSGVPDDRGQLRSGRIIGGESVLTVPVVTVEESGLIDQRWRGRWRWRRGRRGISISQTCPSAKRWLDGGFAARRPGISGRSV